MNKHHENNEDLENLSDKRDIVQFLSFEQLKDQPEELILQTLDEFPRQALEGLNDYKIIKDLKDRRSETLKNMLDQKFKR